MGDALICKYILGKKHFLFQGIVSSGGYWVRRMRQSPQAPPFFGGPPSKTAYTVLDSLSGRFGVKTFFFFGGYLDFGRKRGKSEMKLK